MKITYTQHYRGDDPAPWWFWAWFAFVLVLNLAFLGLIVWAIIEVVTWLTSK